MAPNDSRPPSFNPYAAVGTAPEPSDLHLVQRELTILEIITESVRLFLANIFLVSAIVWTVWIPGNLLNNYLAYHVYSVDELSKSARASMWINGILGPLCSAGLLYVLSKRRSGESVRYVDAMVFGFRNWGRLFAARFVAGLRMLIGFIFLVIPGIVLGVRYAFVDSTSVLESRNSGSAIPRSSTLTVGFRWRIFLTWTVYLIALTALNILAYLPLTLFPDWDVMSIAVIIDCGLDIPRVTIEVVMFLYYVEAIKREKRRWGDENLTTAPATDR